MNDFQVVVHGQERLAKDVLSTSEQLNALADDSEKAEHFVAVEWLATVPEEQAVKGLGLFGNQNTVCQPTAPKWRHTVEMLKAKFRGWDG